MPLPKSRESASTAYEEGEAEEKRKMRDGSNLTQYSLTSLLYMECYQRAHIGWQQSGCGQER